MSKSVVVKWLAVLFWAGGLSALAQNQKPETLVRWHYIGSDGLTRLEDATQLKEVLELPETRQLRELALDRVSRRAGARFTKQDTNSPAAKIAAATIKPLLADLLKNESRLELVTVGERRADWMLALRLDDDAAARWSTNLWQMVTAARLGQPSAAHIAKNPGWMAEHEGYRIGFSRARDWIVVEGGYSPMDSHEKTFKDFRKTLGKKPKSVLEADLNLQQLAEIWDAPKLAHSPKIKLAVTPKEDGLRSEMDLEYPHDLGIKKEKWEIPFETIRDPLIGFTAFQGFRDKLAKNEKFRQLQPENIPNQVFLWNQSLSPFSVTWAADVGNPRIVISNIVSKLVPELNKKFQDRAIGQIVYNTNTYALSWTRLPVVVPFLRPAEGKDAEFLTGGLFPLANAGTNPPPAGLFKQLDKKDLIFYDWEITDARIAQWRPIWQLTQILQDRQFPGQAVSEKWLQAASPKLGNTVTEITVEGDKELQLVRQSHIGFSAAELVLLTHWLDPDDVTNLRAPRSNTERRRPGNRTPAPPQQAPPVTP